jgi:hypothetical protein
MAKIENTTAYPTVTPAADDLLIGTDVNNDNQTVTFKISDIVGAGGVAQDLQSVLTVGNTSTLGITLTGASGNIACTDIYPVTVTAQGATGNAGQILSSTGTGIQWIDSPTVTCCGLNDVLTVANTATTAINVDGVALTVQNAGGSIDITTPAVLTNSGTSTFTNTVNINGTSINFNATGQINDGSGATGAAGSFLTSTGTGLAWSTTLPSAANPTLQEVLTAGNTAAGVGITFTGASTTTFSATSAISSDGNNEWGGNNVFNATGTLISTAGVVLNGTVWAGSSVGVAGKFLASTGTGVDWATPTVADNTLQEVLDAGNSATGANANITITGFMKPGTIQDSGGAVGAAGQVLTSTGTGLSWAAAGTGAVTSVALAGASGVSTGANDVLTITPTTGAVVVTTNAFDGAAKVGHVPSSVAVAQTTHFLRADGSWQIPAQNNPHGVQQWKIGSTNRSYTSGNYYTFPALTSLDRNTYDINNDLGASSPNAAPPSQPNHIAGILFTNPGEGISCSTGITDLPMCNCTVNLIASVTGTYTIELWKVSSCTPAGSYTLAAEANCIITVANEYVCRSFTWISTALRTLQDGTGRDSYYITMRTSFTNASVNVAANIALRW